MVIETIGSPLRDSRRQHQTCEPVVYFYCNRKEPERRSPTTIMQAIVKQLSMALPSNGLPKPVVAEYDKRVKGGLAAGPLEFQESNLLLISLLDIFPRTTIIIDALDESDPIERGRLLEVLTTIMHLTTSVVKIFISSRDDIDIKLKLGGVPNLYIEAQDNSEDIKRFIYREIGSTKNRRLYNLPDELKNEIVSALTKKANGM